VTTPACRTVLEEEQEAVGEGVCPCWASEREDDRVLLFGMSAKKNGQVETTGVWAPLPVGVEHREVLGLRL
jgi:hypothetical protein